MLGGRVSSGDAICGEGRGRGREAGGGGVWVMEGDGWDGESSVLGVSKAFTGTTAWALQARSDGIDGLGNS